jgi:hypothetical protein
LIKDIKNSIAILLAFSMLCVLGILPAASGTCGDYATLEVLAGQKIVLQATPDDSVHYFYLWTHTGVIPTFPSSTPTPPATIAPDAMPSITIYAPAYDSTPGATNLYSVTAKVTNKHPVSGTCTDSKTICFHVNPPECALCDGDECVTHLPADSTGLCPPLFDYTGYEGTNYQYTYETLSHTGYTGVILYQGTTADYSMNTLYGTPATTGWAKLDQPSSTATHVCTTVQFSIKDGSGTSIGTPCTKVICLNYNPTAGITPTIT